MEYGILGLIAAVVAGGCLGAVGRAWSLSSRLYALESALAVVERTLTHEIKARAATERWKRPSKDEQVADELAAALQKSKPEPSKPWWMKLPKAQ